MPKRVSWKKGMRLTDEILTISDGCMADMIGNAFVLCTAGRFGLFPNSHPFKLTVDINKNIIDVVSIDCLGITQDGTLIEAEYNTNYTNSFDTRTFIPTDSEDKTFLLCIEAENNWRDTYDGLCEMAYSFSVIEENTKISVKALPIARIVYDEYCWRVDEIDFIPPCLFVSSFNLLEEEYQKYQHILSELDMILPRKFITESKDALRIFLPSVQQLRITMDKEHDLMTPMTFLGNIQKCVSSFVCACNLDDYINIGEPETFLNYINSPYNFKNVYKMIKEGVKLCSEIYEKINNFDNVEQSPKHTEIEAPYIEKEQLRQIIKYGNAKVKITNRTPGAIVYYTTDGSIPSESSMNGTTVTIESGFTDDWHKEPPRVITLKVVAIKDGISSKVETYEVHIRKGNPFEGRKI